MGTGIGKLGFQDLEVLNNERGGAFILVRHHFQERFGRLSAIQISFVTASVILEGKSMKVRPHRPTKALIHLGAIRQNIQQMGAHIPKEHLKFAVVKANAYGMGLLLWRRRRFRMKLMALRFQYR